MRQCDKREFQNPGNPRLVCEGDHVALTGYPERAPLLRAQILQQPDIYICLLLPERKCYRNKHIKVIIFFNFNKI